MPKFDLSLPKVNLPEGDIKIKGPDIKGRKIEMPTVNISLPKGKTDVDIDIDGHSGKGGKFHMPSLDISLPKIKTKAVDVDIEGPEVKGDMSLPKIKPSEVDVSIEGPEIEGGNLNLPTVDISLPKGKADADLSIKGPEVKGGNFKVPKFNVSLPKVTLPEGNMEIPTVDISLPKGKVKGDVDIDGHEKGKFHMPSVDLSLHKIKAKGVDGDIQGPELEGDISFPQGKVEGDLNIQGPDTKGGKFNMPNFDVSLPKINLPEGDFKIKGPDIKGRKIEMPDIDFSLPKGKTGGEIEIERHDDKGHKFHMPSLDISVPKIKAKGPDIHIEAPEGKGVKLDLPSLEVSLPKIKSPDVDISIEGPNVRDKVNILTDDISLPTGKAEGDISVEGPDVRGGKFKMPKVDVSLPKAILPSVDTNVKGTDMKGKMKMPAVNILLPKGKADVEIDIDKGGRFHMPSLDISLPKIKAQGVDVDIKGPEIKGDMSLPKTKFPELDVSPKGPKFKGSLPAVDISVPEETMEGDISIEGLSGKEKFDQPKADLSGKKGGGLHMPTLDINLPKLDLDLSFPSGLKDKNLKLDTNSPDVAGNLELPGLKGDFSPATSKVNGADIETGNVEDSGVSIKIPTVKLPSVDISAPKVDLDFGLNKPKCDDVEVELLKAEGGRPYSGGSFELPDVALKVPSFTLPRFGTKSKSGDLQISGKGSKGDISLGPPHVEGEMRAPSVEFDGKGKVKVKRTKIRMPSLDISKKNINVSLSCPDVEKGKTDISKPGFNVERSYDKSKYKVKFPKFKISSKGPPPEGEVDAKMETDAVGKGGFHAPDVHISSPKFSLPGFGPKEKDLGKPTGYLDTRAKVKMPSVELSLPASKTPETEVLLPKAEVDVSDADISGYEGNLKIPKMPVLDISIPKLDLDVSLPKVNLGKKVDGEGDKFKIPDVRMQDIDLSLPTGKSGIEAGHIGVNAEGGKFKMPHIRMPDMAISLPTGQTSKIEGPEVEVKGGEGKVKMPSVDVSLPVGKSGALEVPDIDIEGDGDNKFRMPHIKVPNVDITLSKAQTGKPISDIDVERERSNFRMAGIKMPNIDISLPKGKTGKLEGSDVEIKGGGKLNLPHVNKPNVDINLPKINAAKVSTQDVEVKGGGAKLTMPHFNMPSVDISPPKGKSECPDVEIEGGIERKIKLPHVEMSDVNISLPKTNTDTTELGAEGGIIKLPQTKMPRVDILLPKGKVQDIDTPAMIEVTEGKVHGPDATLPKGAVSVPKDLSGEVKINLTTAEAGGNVKGPHITPSDVEINVTGSKPKLDIDAHGEAGLHVEGEHKDLKIKMPTIEIKVPKGDLELDLGLHRGEGNKDKKKVELPDLDLNITGTKSKMKGPKVKGTRFKIGKSKMKTDRNVPTGAKMIEYEVETHSGHNKDKDHNNIAGAEVTLPCSANLQTVVEGGLPSSRAEIKVPRIPDIEFDISTSQDEGGEKDKNIKIPKFGVPLPSISSPEGRMNMSGPEIQYEGPKMPKVKKAVFVLVNPPQKDMPTACTGQEETSSEAEAQEVKMKMPKSLDKSDAINTELEGEEKSEVGKITTPQVSFSPNKSLLIDVAGSRSSVNNEQDASPLKGFRDDKQAFGKIKLPKVEFTSPYGKMTAKKEEMSVTMGKDSSPREEEKETKGLKVQSGIMASGGYSEEPLEDVVSSHARTEMLDRDCSAAPTGFTQEVSSTKVQAWNEVESKTRQSEEKESSSWFKVPKFTLKPHSTD